MTFRGLCVVGLLLLLLLRRLLLLLVSSLRVAGVVAARRSKRTVALRASISFTCGCKWNPIAKNELTLFGHVTSYSQCWDSIVLMREGWFT